MAFLAEQDDLWLSAMVVHELEFGLQLLPHGQRRDVFALGAVRVHHGLPGPHPACGQNGRRVGGLLSCTGASIRDVCWTWGMRSLPELPGLMICRLQPGMLRISMAWTSTSPIHGKQSD